MMRYIRMTLRALLPAKPAMTANRTRPLQDHADKTWLRDPQRAKLDAAKAALGRRHLTARNSTHTWERAAHNVPNIAGRGGSALY